jgi:hypothetical protein
MQKNCKLARTWLSENRDKEVYCGNHFRKSHATKSIMGNNLYCMIIIYPKTALRPSTLLQKAACKGEKKIPESHMR